MGFFSAFFEPKTPEALKVGIVDSYRSIKKECIEKRLPSEEVKFAVLYSIVSWRYANSKVLSTDLNYIKAKKNNSEHEYFSVEILPMLEVEDENIVVSLIGTYLIYLEYGKHSLSNKSYIWLRESMSICFERMNKSLQQLAYEKDAKWLDLID